LVRGAHYFPFFDGTTRTTNFLVDLVRVGTTINRDPLPPATSKECSFET
jgi:hypothetical protein